MKSLEVVVIDTSLNMDKASIEVFEIALLDAVHAAVITVKNTHRIYLSTVAVTVKVEALPALPQG